MLRVVDATQRPAGGFATMFLALLGAEVVRFETGGTGGEIDGHTRTYLSQVKTVRALDLRNSRSWESLTEAANSADVVVEDGLAAAIPEVGLAYDDLAAQNARVVVTSISPFGADGPRANWASSELVTQAMGGVLAASGHSGGPPQMLAGFQAGHVAGLHAAILTLAAAHAVKTGVRAEGVHIDVAEQEVMSSHWTREIERYVYTGEDTRRQSQQLGLQGFPHTAMTRDGYLFLLALGADWASLASFLGLDGYVGAPWDDAHHRVEHWAEVEPAFGAALLAKGRYEWFAEAAERGWTLAPIDDPVTIPGSPQLNGRGFFHATTADGAPLPGLPFPWERLSAVMRADEDGRVE